MRLKHLSAGLTLLFLAHSCESIFFPAVVGPGATAIATTIAPNLLGIAAAAGAAKLLGLGALALASKNRKPKKEQYTYYHQNDYNQYHHHRRRREASEEEQQSLLKVIRELEPEDCMKKMICGLAALDRRDNPILFPFDAESTENNLSTKNDLANEYRAAAKVGKSVKNVNNCGSFYKCSISSEYLLKLASL